MTSDIYRTGKPKSGNTRPTAFSLDNRMQSLSRSREQLNPMRSLTLARAVSLMEAMQRGDLADLQWLYFFVEMTDATPFALVERRVSSLLEMDWNIKTVDQKKRGVDFDEKLAKDQEAVLRAAYDRIKNLYAAIEHLEMASFRSFAHVQPQLRETGADPIATFVGCNHFEILNQWNFARDGMYGPWYWNPNALSGGTHATGAEQIDPATVIVRECPRHINRIALVKFIRKNLGEKDWSAFLEIYGIPACFIIGPPDVPQEKEADYEAAAKAAAEGGSGSLPNGSDVKFADSPRGTNPFLDYIKYFDEQMVLAGTGGKLTMLSDSTGIGSGASDAQENTFRSIAKMEARRISELLQQSFDARVLEAAFPDKPVLVYFELAFNEETDVGEILEHAGLAKNAGFQMDAEELSEKTGYKLTAAPIPPGEAGVSPSAKTGIAGYLSPASPSLSLVANKAGDPDELVARAMFDLADAERRVLKPVAQRLQAIVAIAEPAAREAALIRLRDELPEILKQINANPETARVMEHLMAAELANGIADGAGGAK